MSALPVSIDLPAFATSLSARFGVALHPEANKPRGVAAAIRASDIDSPNGFAIHVIPGWRSLEAAFVADNYAGALIRKMGTSSDAARERFAVAAAAFSTFGFKVTAKVNGSATADLSLLDKGMWAQFELHVVRLTDLSGGNAALTAVARDVCTACLSLVLMLLDLEASQSEVEPALEGGLPEGAKVRVEVNRYERSPANRAACIAIHGLRCKACGFDFSAFYGDLGEGYIEVHHRIPVSKMGASYVIDPGADLVPVCSNCHSMLHRLDPPVAVEKLSQVIESQRQS
jgi:5-methylcytosine-specific restriction enzyme A